MNRPMNAAGRQGWQIFVLLAAVAFLATVPLILHGPSCGHDFDFHLVSWMEALRSWHSGIYFPHWTTSPNYGAGEPRFIFYPPLTWMLGASLGALLPWNWTAQAFTFLALFACGGSLYLLAREWLSKEASLLAACLYVVSPYTIFNAYTRTAYGELLAGAWLPLIVLFALRKKTSSVWLAIVLAGIWLTNAPGAVMGEYLLALIVIVSSLEEHSLQPLRRVMWGQILGLGLASFYILPAAYEQRWVAISEAIGPGMRVEDSWLFEKTGQSFHDQVLRTASWQAVLLIALAAIGAFIAWRNSRHEDRRLLLPFIVFLPVLLFLLFPISNFFWQHLPELKFLQFPWRWLVVASIAAALLLATAGRQKVPGKLHWLILLLLAICIAFVPVENSLFYQSCDEEDAVSAQVQLFHADTGVEGTDEYAPLDTDNTAIQQGLPAVRILQNVTDDASPEGSENPEWSDSGSDSINAAVTVQLWAPERKRLVIESQGGGYAVLRLRDYPAWKVRVNEKLLPSRPHRPDGLMVVPIRSGWSQITIEWEATPDVLLGRIFTGMALVALLGTALWNRKYARQVS